MRGRACARPSEFQLLLSIVGGILSLFGLMGGIALLAWAGSGAAGL